jgi:DNA-binding transcriptional LysR family regulator
LLPATFRQLQTFALVVEAGSFAGAADRLGVSPAAVSDQIRSLEKKLGYALFDRRPGAPPLLSDAGARLLSKTPTLLDTAAELAAVSGSAAKARPTVRVAAGDFILERLILPRLAGFQLANPGIQIAWLRLPPGPAAVRAFKKGEYDLGYFSFRSRDPDPAAELLGLVAEGLYISPDHPVARTWDRQPRPRLPMIMPLSGSNAERTVQSVLAQAGVTDFLAVTHAQSFATVIDLAIQGAGACFIFQELARDAVAQGKLVELPVRTRPLYRFALRQAGFDRDEAQSRVDAFITGLLRDSEERQG